MNRTLPEPVDVREGLVGIRDVELLPVEAVLQVELAAPSVIAILDDDVRLAEVRHARQDGVADDLPVFLHDHPPVAFQPIQVEVELVDKLLREVVPQERCIVLDGSYLEDLCPSLPAGPSQLLPLFLRRLVPSSLDVLE